MIKFRNLSTTFRNVLIRPKMPDIWKLLSFIYFPFRTLRPNVNDVVTILALEHWLLWCEGHLFGLISRHFRSNLN